MARQRRIFEVTMFVLTCDKLGVARPVCVQNDYSLNNRTFDEETPLAWKRATYPIEITRVISHLRFVERRKVEKLRKLAYGKTMNNYGKPRLGERWFLKRKVMVIRKIVEVLQSWGAFFTAFSLSKNRLRWGLIENGVASDPMVGTLEPHLSVFRVTFWISRISGHSRCFWNSLSRSKKVSRLNISHQIW